MEESKERRGKGGKGREKKIVSRERERRESGKKTWGGRKGTEDERRKGEEGEECNLERGEGRG